ncbi:hypothetical protein FisN_1Lh113 [Fistulifera solaris]|uniref:Uncharacterized protein n=1 Tax=Fistulifera solaris TaxID=1519565 RepID=A0A1Z5K4W6_FISSO|nr:hypothetical protein FisN_1Lh113 [Fistulifera solaris]|eukprot:GAX21283.1 hypothetical protein FisN_1Lh113 [Fistulifera solaris]
MGSEEVHKRKGQTVKLVKTVFCIITVTALFIKGIQIFKDPRRSNKDKKNTEINREFITGLRSSLQEDERGPKTLPIVWSQLRTLDVITEVDKPVAGRQHPNAGRREFRFMVGAGDWTGKATTPSHHHKPFSVRIPLHATVAFQNVMSNVTMFRAVYAHASDPLHDAPAVYRPYFTPHDNAKHLIRFGFEDKKDDLEIVSISHEHCNMDMWPVQCGHFPWVVLPHGANLSSAPSPQWIINTNLIDEALDTISIYMRG